MCAKTAATFADFFACTYVLNLADRPDRLEHIRTELETLEMPIDGARVRRFDAIRPATKEPFHKLGSKGCFLSVLEMLKSAAADGVENVLIIQDDAHFTDAFRAAQPEIVEQLRNEPWDLAQFGYEARHAAVARELALTPGQLGYGTLRPFTSGLIQAHCFAVNGSSLADYIAFLEDILGRPRDHPLGGPMPIDGTFNLYARLPGKVRLVLQPSLVDQISSRSDVTPNPLDRIPFVRPLLARARKSGVMRGVRSVSRRSGSV